MLDFNTSLPYVMPSIMHLRTPNKCVYFVESSNRRSFFNLQENTDGVVGFLKPFLYKWRLREYNNVSKLLNYSMKIDVKWKIFELSNGKCNGRDISGIGYEDHVIWHHNYAKMSLLTTKLTKNVLEQQDSNLRY